MTAIHCSSNFDTFDRTGGTVNFQLNNIEQGRNLAREPIHSFCFVDDDGDGLNELWVGDRTRITRSCGW